MVSPFCFEMIPALLLAVSESMDKGGDISVVLLCFQCCHKNTVSVLLFPDFVRSIEIKRQCR